VGVVSPAGFEIERAVSENSTLFAAGAFTLDDCLKSGYRHSLVDAAKKQKPIG
jgi:hypothetical protein